MYHVNHIILESLKIKNLIWEYSNAVKKELVLRKIDQFIWFKKGKSH